MDKEAAVLILSGGMDSTTLLYNIGQWYEVWALSFIYGQRHVREIQAAEQTCRKLNVSHEVVKIPNIFIGSSLTDDIPVPHGHYTEESMALTVVPNRNMIMLSLAIGYALSNKIYHVFYGAHSGDHAIYADCRPRFVSAMQAVATICDQKEVHLRAPYLFITKNDIAVIGAQLGVDYSLTWTCYEGGEYPCRKCGACVERSEAFAFAGMVDPLLEGENK